MKSENALLKRLSSLDHLPTLPHILLKLIEACNQENQDFTEIVEIVSRDPALSGKILKLVNSAYFGLFRKVETVSEAAVLVGTSGIKNLAICACVVGAFPKNRGNGIFNLKQFWWHSLRCAFLAKNMAAEWDASLPDEAFLSGLLHDIGKVVLWVNYNKNDKALLKTSGKGTDLLLAEETRIGATHAQIGAWLLDRWQLGLSISDCVRYHHEAPERIVHALAMVQIIHVANLLCQEAESDIQAGLATANELLGRDAAQCQVLMAKADQEAEAVARSLDIDVDAHEVSSGLPAENDQVVHNRLMDEIRNSALLIGTLEGFIAAEDQGRILRCIADGLNILFDIRRTVFFLFDEKKQALVGHIPDKSGRYIDHHALAVSMKMKLSLLVRSLVEQRPLDTLSEVSMGPLTIIDEQLNRLLGGSGMLCLPLIAHSDPVGVLALGIDSDDLPHLRKNTSLLNVFIHKGALALRLDKLRRSQLQTIQTMRIDASGDLARRVVHEVNNPLSIIKNYLKVLSMRMAAAGIDHDEIRIINDEITRVGQLLQQLTSISTEAVSGKRISDINAILSDMLTLAKDALLGKSKIHLTADLAPLLPVIETDPDGLKQVFINLIKNAAEAMAQRGGSLEVRTRHLSPALGGKLPQDGKGAGGYVEILIRDDGPGIAEAIREKVFDPYVSTKSGFHSGLGLSVVYNTIRSLHGTIVCESAPDRGTTFIIELPV